MFPEGSLLVLRKLDWITPAITGPVCRGVRGGTYLFKTGKLSAAYAFGDPMRRNRIATLDHNSRGEMSSSLGLSPGMTVSEIEPSQARNLSFQVGRERTRRELQAGIEGTERRELRARFVEAHR